MDDKRASLDKMTSGADFEDAILAAEAFMGQAEKEAERCRILLVAEGAVVGLTIAVIALCVGVSHLVSDWRLGVVSAVVLAFGLITAAAIHRLLVFPLRKRVRRDSRAVVEIVGFLREIMPMISEREGWSETQMLVARTRIARFPIGAKAFR